MPRYLYREDYVEHELAATNLDDAIAEAERILSNADWIDRPLLSTIRRYADVVEVTVDEDGDPCEERYEIDVTFDPDEPDCIDSNGHDWQSPHYLVGGLLENPGVECNGGGVIIKEACVRCGCGRTTDTWAQDLTTGGRFTEVWYSPGEYEDDLDTAENDA
jgi:hypothetical protein